MKQKTCKWCKQKFEPSRPTKICCSPDCEYDYGLKHASRAEQIRGLEDRKVIKAKLEKLKTVAQLAKDAEHWINRIARLRDKNEPCISCDRTAKWGGQWHASHFKSVGSNSALRFNLLNIHKACSICNNHLSGNIAEYARRLPDRIGIERFRFIDNHSRDRKYSREYLIRLKAVAMRWCKRLERRAASEM